VVDAGPDRDQPRRFRIPDEPHGLARDREAILHFRADGNPFKPAAQCIGDVAVALMASVITDILSQQAGADADSDLLHLLFAPFL